MLVSWNNFFSLFVVVERLMYREQQKVEKSKSNSEYDMKKYKSEQFKKKKKQVKQKHKLCQGPPSLVSMEQVVLEKKSKK